MDDSDMDDTSDEADEEDDIADEGPTEADKYLPPVEVEAQVKLLWSNHADVSVCDIINFEMVCGLIKLFLHLVLVLDPGFHLEQSNQLRKAVPGGQSRRLENILLSDSACATQPLQAAGEGGRVCDRAPTQHPLVKDHLRQRTHQESAHGRRLGQGRRNPSK